MENNLDSSSLNARWNGTAPLSAACPEKQGSFWAGGDVQKDIRPMGAEAIIQSSMELHPEKALVQPELRERSAACVVPMSETGAGEPTEPLLFNRFAVIQFGQKDLAIVEAELNTLDEADFWPPPMGVAARQKKAALLLMALNVKRMCGLANKQEIAEMECTIKRLFNEIDSELEKSSIHGITCNQWANPLYLWPVAC